MTNEWPPRYKMAIAKANEKFMILTTYSGMGLMFRDTEATEFLVPIDATNSEVGKAVVSALHQSRILDNETYARLYRANHEDYPYWVKRLMERYGYKTKNALFRKMLNCDIISENGEIIITPSHHERLEAWSGNDRTERLKIHLPADALWEDIGAALRLGFSRCTSRY